MAYKHTVGDPSTDVEQLQKLLPALRERLDETFDKSMDEHIERLMQRDADARARDPAAKPEARLTGAKLLVSAAYVYLDLVWMYLKTQGVDPSTHPVQSELARVHSYFHKLKDITGDKGDGSRINAEAATRFVKAAVGGEAKHKRFSEEEDAQQIRKKGKATSMSEKRAKAADQEADGADEQGTDTTSTKPLKKKKKSSRAEGSAETSRKVKKSSKGKKGV